jgi:hypothetical protein
LGGGGDGSWIPKAGDFLEYSTSVGETQMTTRMTVKSVTETTITMNITMTYPGMPPMYQESTMPKNQTMGYGLDIDNPPSGTSVVKVGTESISTKWGSRSTDHYAITVSGSSGTIDIWIRSGIALKAQSTVMDQTMIVTLTDTNISQITSA